LTDLQELESYPAVELVSWAVRTYGNSFAISNSFQKEDMILVDLAAQAGGLFRIFTLDTGRVHEETYQMMETVRTRYGIRVEPTFPDRDEVERMVAEHGPNLFYGSIEARKMCCEVRKVRPLERKLAEFRAWATGLRREQTQARAGIRKGEEASGRLKLNPLADWTGAQVEEYTAAHGVPVHPLYSRGYTSIGCAPCTRAIEPGEPERAGRWWWEQGGAQECGIHFSPDGTLRRGAATVKSNKG
jgi:thioredoxin-dependent adenylylsulfate APS reductase